MTWEDRKLLAERRKGSRLTLDEMLTLAATHKMTPGEIAAQMESFTRGMMPTGDPRFD